MKKILWFIVLNFILIVESNAQNDCLKMLKGYIPDDNSIKVAHLTDNKLTFYINNIRSMKDINIVEFGFNQSMANLMQKKYNCPKTKFVKAYNSSGIPQPVKINGIFLKDYDNQVIVSEK